MAPRPQAQHTSSAVMRDGQPRARTRDPWRQHGFSGGGGQAICRHSILSREQPPVSRETKAEDGNERDLSEAGIPKMASLQKACSSPSSHISTLCFSEHIAGGSYSVPLAPHNQIARAGTRSPKSWLITHRQKYQKQQNDRAYVCENPHCSKRLLITCFLWYLPTTPPHFPAGG